MNRDFLLGIDERLSDSLEGLVSLYDMDTMRWFARLWDCEHGAFYYSNSARDHEGFLPDLESTSQALRVISNLGMVSSLGGLSVAMPKEISERISGFVDSLLADDGYFYHPQWGKSISITRRGRDLNCARSIYRMLGTKPPRRTAIEMLENKSRSTSDATLPEHLKSKRAFCAYLDGLNISESSYAVGNNINSQIRQIKAAGLEKELCNWLDSTQNLETGLWQKDTSYKAVSGFMNLSGAYILSGRRLNHLDKVMESLLVTVASEIEPSQVVFIYNSIAAVNQVLLLLKNSGDTYGAAKMQNVLMERAPELIDITRRKLEIFRKPDGSYSYTKDFSAHRSQNVPTALFEEREGDVNATSIVANGVIAGLFAVLGVEYKIFDEQDFKEFIGIIKASRPTVKRAAPEGRIV